MENPLHQLEEEINRLKAVNTSLTRQLEEALGQFGHAYLRASALMSRIQDVLKSARPVGRSGQQLAVLTSAVDALAKEYNDTLPMFKAPPLTPEQEKLRAAAAERRRLEAIASLEKAVEARRAEQAAVPPPAPVEQPTATEPQLAQA